MWPRLVSFEQVTSLLGLGHLGPYLLSRAPVDMSWDKWSKLSSSSQPEALNLLFLQPSTPQPVTH